MMESLRQDFRYALRTLAKSSGFAAVAIFTLALGVGANTAMFSIVNAWLLRPLPLKDPQQLVTIWRTRSTNPRQPAYFNLYRDYLIWATQNRSFQSLAATMEQSYAITGAGEPREIHGAVATWNLFRTVGARAELGRLFLEDDLRGGPACVISHALWVGQFHSAADVIGLSVTLSGKLYRIVGVLPADFSLRLLDRPFETAVWTLIAADDPSYAGTSPAAVAAIGRLKPTITVQQAEAELSTLQNDLNHRFADEPENSGVLVSNLQQDNTRTIRSSLLLSFGAVLVLLLVACVNTGSLILGRDSQRAREFAVRVALGCGTRRLLQQLTAEVIVLFVLGGITGLVIAFALIRAFMAWNPFHVLPPGGVALDTTVLATTAALICVTTLLFGSLPALRAVQVRENDALRTSMANATTGRSQLRSRFLFVAAEISFSVVLLLGAGLLISTFIRINSEAVGFETHDVFVTSVAAPYSTYPDISDQSRFGSELLMRLRELPAIRAAGISLSWPFNVNGLTPIEIDSATTARVSQLPQAATFVVSDGYFEALGIPLRGRAFDRHDTKDSALVAVISDEMARQYFGADDPIGKRVRLRYIDEKTPKEPWLTVVGVVGTTRSVRYNQLQWDRYPAVYTSFFQRQRQEGVHNFRSLNIYLYLQAAHPLESAMIARAVHEINPNLPLGDFRSTGEIVSSLRSQPRVRAVLLGAFGGLTLLLAAVGIAGVMSQMVEQRRRELGIRIALGANASDIRGLVMSCTLMLTGCGVAVGIGSTAALSRLLSSFLYGVSPLDPLTIAAVIAVLCAASVLAAYVPAKRAAKVDPITSLRAE